MKRPSLYVAQREQTTENGSATYWYVLKARNGHVIAVEFTYVTGPRPERDPNGTRRDWRTERVRC